ncbi:MAG: hypothetical protein PF541_00235 [Prolixibacteraceae bacterium]|nr:hypothetical protein [Prolixibacteraceae bacterium]
MKTKLFFTLITFVLSFTFARAQTTDQANISFVVIGGVNFQNLNGKAFNGDKLENDKLRGYQVGVNVQIPLAPKLYFQPGILLSSKGMKNMSVESTSTISLRYF